MTLVLFAAGAILFIIAVFAAIYGRRQHHKRALVEDTETTDVKDIKDEGLVELKGTVRADDTVDSPIKGEKSTLSAWEVEEWDERGESEMWQTRATGIYAAPFELDDGTGTVHVDVGDHVSDASSGTGIDDVQVGAIDVDRLLSDGVAVDNTHAALNGFSVETSVSPDADPPDRIREFVQGETAIGTQTDSITNVLDAGTQHGERRYYEGTLGPSDDIYLLGQARATEDATHPLKPEDIVISPSGDGQFIISDKSEAELMESFGEYKYAYAGAVAAAVAGVVAIAVGAIV
jgi:hypothetical protein